MPTSFRPYEPDQTLLLPPSLREWLPDEHLAYFVSDLVGQLDLSTFYARYEGDGRRNQPFEPRMLVQVLIYGYSTGVYSSRKLAKKLEEDVAFRVLAAGNQPAHRTICEFRQRHLAELAALFVQVVRVAGRAGVLKLGRIAVDGTKVKANASKRKAMSYGRMQAEEQRLRGEIDKILAAAGRQDEAEDKLYGKDKRGDELPEELSRRESRLKQIQAAKRRLEEEQAAADRERGRTPDDERKPRGPGPRYKRDFGIPEDKAQSNFTDPESRIMKTSAEGYQQGYNGQAAVDEDTQLIVATGLINNAADNGELISLVEQAEANAGEEDARIEEVLADAGYRSEESFAALEQRKTTGYVSLGREGKELPQINGEELPATLRMRERLSQPPGRDRYRRRKAIVEPVFGWIKQVLGFRRFSFRGLQKVGREWDLVCTAVNIKRLHALGAAI